MEASRTRHETRRPHHVQLQVGKTEFENNSVANTSIKDRGPSWWDATEREHAEYLAKAPVPSPMARNPFCKKIANPNRRDGNNKSGINVSGAAFDHRGATGALWPATDDPVLRVTRWTVTFSAGARAIR